MIIETPIGKYRVQLTYVFANAIAQGRYDMKIKHMCTFMSLFIWCFDCYALQLDTPEVQVRFEIPTNPLITRTFTKDRNKITVLANYHTEKDIPDNEPEAYSPLLYAILKTTDLRFQKII